MACIGEQSPSHVTQVPKSFLLLIIANEAFPISELTQLKESCFNVINHRKKSFRLQGCVSKRFIHDCDEEEEEKASPITAEKFSRNFQSFSFRLHPKHEAKHEPQL